MNLPRNGGCDFGEVIVRPNRADTRDETISLRGLGYTPLAWQNKHHSTPSERNLYVRQDKSIGTNISEVIRVTFPSIQKDTFMDDAVGDTLQQIKSKLGNAPFIEAYKAALDTFKKPDRRWKEYGEEEARQRSIFNEGVDCVL
ncbi:MAG: hypothetical protein NTX42_06465 [Methanothrix sp.]|nr:hypothetical protein [Methanothrix sp.]